MENTLKKMTLEFCGSGKHKISLEALFALGNALFLDVRDKKEVEVLRFDLNLFGIETQTIPIDELPLRYETLPQEKTIVCFCSSGTRAAWAYLFLLSKKMNALWLDATNEDLAGHLKPGKILKAWKR